MTSNSQQKMIRIPSKLTDELITIDSPKRQSRTFSKSMNTTQQFRKKLSQSKNSILHETQSLWLQSATANTREKSPSFRFSQAQRFSTVEQDERKNRLIIKLNIANDLAGRTGASFAKSKRIDHFKPKKFVEDFPSPASYCSELIATKINTIRAQTASGNRASLLKMTSEYLSSQLKGMSIPRQKNPERVFMHHGQKLPYHPHITINNPGVGKYLINPEGQAFTTKKCPIGQSLKKFNEIITPNPGAGAYGVEGQMVPKRAHSANCKGTFQKSKRTYLVEPHPQNFSPSPNSYKLKRFMEK